MFTCAAGYGLRGPQETSCLPSGEWALPFPTCTGNIYVVFMKNLVLRSYVTDLNGPEFKPCLSPTRCK